ncbi:hypothetical protein BDV18DRAFT_161458 [Aspergillus unguis]
MVTGLPPFYHKNSTERQHNIVDQKLQLPESIPSTARDLLASLLHKDPTRRLGANGAAEIKAHSFFECVDWGRCVPGNYTAPFKPRDDALCFRGKLYTDQSSKAPKNEFRVHEGEVYEQLGSDDWPLWIPRGQVVDKNAVSINTRDNEDWELVKDSSDEEFYFRNCITDEKVKARTRQVFASKHKQEAALAALAAALEAGYSQQVFSQILSYGVNLNIHVLDFDETINRTTPDGTQYKPDIRNCIPVTPLEWAVEHNQTDLIKLFLEHGADPNYTIAPRHGPALLKPVKRKAQDLINVLVQRTDRVSCTRALGWAVELDDITSAHTLLAHGVRCDFEEGDRPAPPHPWYHDNDSLLYRTLETPDLTSPLVRAARLGNARMVSLLLAHGTNANAAYHDLGGRLPDETDTRDSLIPASFAVAGLSTWQWRWAISGLLNCL